MMFRLIWDEEYLELYHYGCGNDAEEFILSPDEQQALLGELLKRWTSRPVAN